MLPLYRSGRGPGGDFGRFNDVGPKGAALSVRFPLAFVDQVSLLTSGAGRGRSFRLMPEIVDNLLTEARFQRFGECGWLFEHH